MQEIPAGLELLVVEGADEVHVGGRFALLFVDSLIAARATAIHVLEIAERCAWRTLYEKVWSLLLYKLQGADPERPLHEIPRCPSGSLAVRSSEKRARSPAASATVTMRGGL